MGERINFVLNGTLGTASNGGGAFDATNGSEVKTVFYAQPSKCNACGSKVHHYATRCRCGSTDLKQIKDTRWGIDAKAHFKYEGHIPYYFFVIISPLNKDIDNLRFNVDIYKIDADDPVFNEILQQQLAKGSSTHKNFMPFGRDFFMSSPTQVLSVNVTVTDDDVTYDYIVTEPTKLKRIRTSLFTKAERATLDNFEEVYVRTAYELIGLGNTTHGKARGETSRKIT